MSKLPEVFQLSTYTLYLIKAYGSINTCHNRFHLLQEKLIWLFPDQISELETCWSVKRLEVKVCGSEQKYQIKLYFTHFILFFLVDLRQSEILCS